MAAPLDDEDAVEDEFDEDDGDSKVDPAAMFEDEEYESASFHEYEFIIGYLRQALKAEKAMPQELEKRSTSSRCVSRMPTIVRRTALPRGRARTPA